MITSEEPSSNAMDLDVQQVPDSQGQVCLFSRPRQLPTDAVLRQVTPISISLSDKSGILRLKVFPHDGVVTCWRKIYICHFVQFILSMLRSFIGFVLLLIMLLSLVQGCEALNPVTSGVLSIYALNANGMVHEGKLTQISNVIKTRRPHIVVISETKTHDKVGKKLDTNDYSFVEETGVKMNNHHLYKWGVVVGI